MFHGFLSIPCWLSFLFVGQPVIKFDLCACFRLPDIAMLSALSFHAGQVGLAGPGRQSRAVIVKFVNMFSNMVKRR